MITKNTSSATDSTGFSVAKVNSEGKIEKSYRDDALISSQKDLQSYIDKIYTNGQESGFIGSYRYLKAETKTGNVIRNLTISEMEKKVNAEIKNP